MIVHRLTCEGRQAVMLLHFWLMNSGPKKPADEAVCETNLMALRAIGRLSASTLVSPVCGLRVVWSLVRTLVQRIPARRSATERSVGRRLHEASAVLDSSERMRKADQPFEEIGWW